jgi:NAD(P)-dependent dehydrogenase (short-subunit alcohol dehydrogenase family)
VPHKAGTLSIRTNRKGGVADYPFTDLNLTEITQKIPLRRLGTPDEVADAAAFLAKNDYANNCILNLDGGLSAT